MFFKTDYIVRVYNKDKLTCTISINKQGIVTFKNGGDFPAFFYPFGINEEANMDMLQDFYKDRCFPEERVNCKDLVHELGLDYYEPELICRKTHGLQFDDFLWLQFSDEEQVCWNDIKLRD